MIFQLFVSAFFLLFFHGLHAAETSEELNYLSEVKVYQADKPYRNAEEDWSLAEARLSSLDWSKWRSDRVSALDYWMESFKDRPSFIAGWQHDFVNQITGIAENWRPWTPMPSTSNQKYYQAWVSYARSYNIGMVLEASRMYRLTGEIKYATWSIEQIDFYADYYDNWPLRTWNGRSKMMGQSLDEAVVTMQLLEAVRLLSNEVDDKRKDRWKKRLFYPVVGNLLNFNQGVNNIALWHASEITLTGLVFKDDNLVDIGTELLGDLLNKGITRDYIWHEGSFNYNYYALRALAPLIVNASLLGSLERVLPVAVKAENMLVSPLQFVFDDNYLPTPGDSNGRLPYQDKDLYLQLNRVLPTTIASQYKSTKNWDVLFTPEISKGISSKSINTLVKTKNSDSLQMAVLKSFGWQVFVHYGQATSFHAQEEALNFELYSQNIPVTVDPGTVSYGSEFHKNYFAKAYAHNVPLINHKGQSKPLKADSVRFDADQNSIDVTTTQYNDKYIVNRKYQITSGGFTDYLNIYPKIKNDTKDKLGVIFNTECLISLNELTSKSNSIDIDFANDFKYWKNTKQLSNLKKLTLNLTCIDKKIQLLIDSSNTFNLFLSDAPTTPLSRSRQAIYIETIATNSKFNFTYKLVK